MAEFRFRLATLLKLRGNDRRQRQMELAQALEAERLLKQQADDVSAEVALTKSKVRGASSPGAVPVDSLLEFQRYALQLSAQAAMIAERMGQIRAEVERRRMVLVEADRQVRMLEKLREKQATAFQFEALKRQQNLFDEIAQRTFDPTHGS